MTTIDAEIAKLSNPSPNFLDPDDDEYLDSPTPEFENEQKNLFKTSSLRSKTAPLLEDVDQAYTGQKVTRKSKGLIFDKGSSDDSKIEIESDFSESDSDTDDDESEDNISNFKKDLVNSEAEDSSCSGNSEDEEAEKDDMVIQFSNIDVNNDIKKGNAIKAQQEIWNKLCECRIKLQKLLIIANKLPQTDSWHLLKNVIGEEMLDPVSKGNEALKSLLNSFINLKQELSQSTEGDNESVNDMEVTSGSDEENKTEEVIKKETNSKQGVKRKSDDYNEVLSKQFKTEKISRNKLIQKWDDKVCLSTGKMTQKSFDAFGNSAVKQIEQILQDKSRLIRRTQLKRSVYRIIADFKSKTNLEETTSKQDLLLKDFDAQIFDDDDFYRQLLKDIIQNKSIGIDPSIVRKQMELQKIRNKMKRKVDTKASKGRKLRYDVHPKLVNFMAPDQSTTMSDETRENLMKCLFGKSDIS